MRTALHSSPGEDKTNEIQAELDDLMSLFRIPKFQHAELEWSTDRNGIRILSFSDGIESYHVPILQDGVNPEACIPEVDEIFDEVFFLANNKAALIIHPKRENEQRKCFLLGLHCSRNSSFINVMRHNREALIQLLKEKNSYVGGQKILAAVESMPKFRSGYHDTFVVPVRWDPELITDQLSNETDGMFQERSAYINDPFGIRTTIQTMPQLMQETLMAPHVNFKSLMMFISFYANSTHEKRKLIEGAYMQAKEQKVGTAFVNAFSACDAGWHIGDYILDVAEGPLALDVFTNCEKLFYLQQDILVGSIERVAELLNIDLSNPRWKEIFACMHEHLDTKVFYSIIAYKRAKLLESASKDNIDFKLFKPEDVLWGAILKAITAKAFDLQTYLAMETLMEDTQLRIIQGSPDLVINQEDMENEDNYPHPEVFNVNDYQFLKSSLEKAYKGKSDKWLRGLIKKIPKDLTNPDVSFVTLRREGKLAAICKIRPEDKNPVNLSGEEIKLDKKKIYYFGTHYVDETLQQSYGLGKLVQTVAFGIADDDAQIIATVSVTNGATERHLKEGAIGLGLVREGDKISQSKELLLISWRYNGSYESKKRHLNLVSNQDPQIKIIQVNAECGENQSYLEACEYLRKGYVMTQFLKQDSMRNVAVVFEKRAA